MNELYSKILTEGELYVLAGMMGYSSLFAVKSKTMERWQSDMNGHVRKVAAELEKRMLLYTEPSGVVYIEDTLYKCVECLCNPDTAAVISGNAMTGRYSETYLFRRNNVRIELSKTASGVYKLTAYSAFDFDEYLKYVETDIEIGSFISERLPIKVVENAKEALASFDFELAKKLLREHTSTPDSLEKILQTLSMTERYFRISCVCKNGTYYKDNFQMVTVVCGGSSIQITQDDNERLSFCSINRDKIKAQLSAVLK